MSTEERQRLAAELRETLQRGTMWTVLLHHTVAGKAGLNVTDLQCLNLLSLDGPMTPGRLAQAMGITTGGAITAVVDRLERAGYVRRSRDPHDRRRVIVELVPQATARIAGYFEPVAASVQARFAGFSDDQLRTLLEFARANNAAMPHVIKQVQALP
jgi:DNA-binding MarR family transcriptional regulator